MRTRTKTRSTSPRPTTSGDTFKTAKGWVKKAGNYVENAATIIESADNARQVIADMGVAEIVTTCVKAASQERTPVGVGGKNLLPTTARDVAISSDAQRAITTSASMFMYRPPRKRSSENVQYIQKMSGGGKIETSADTQEAYDVNVLDAVPVKDNPTDSAINQYSKLTVKRAFDDHLLSEFSDYSGDAYTAKVNQSSLHFKSLSIELNITNNESTGCMLDVYELVPQHTLGPTEYETSKGVFSAVGYMSPRWTFESGLESSDVIFAGADMPYSKLGSKPSNSSVFSRTWKQVKHLRLNMAGNTVHRHKSAYSINKTVSYQEYAQFSTSGGKFASWNPTFLFVQRGVPSGTTQALASSITFSTNFQLNYEGSPDKQNKVIVYTA